MKAMGIDMTTISGVVLDVEKKQPAGAAVSSALK